MIHSIDSVLFDSTVSSVPESIESTAGITKDDCLVSQPLTLDLQLVQRLFLGNSERQNLIWL